MDQIAINYVKSLGIDMIDTAGSGHPGIVLSAAPIIYSVYANHLIINPRQLENEDRDRFVMSAGHGSALLYATLHLFGFPISMTDLQNFRKIDSKTPGHPENFLTAGVEMTTGPLGQGVAGAVGMAMAAKYKNNNNRIYVLCSDGDLMEGVAYEACSLAGNLALDNLIILYDSNDVTLDGKLSKSFSENIAGRFRSMGFDYFLVDDGNDFTKINQAIIGAKNSNRPSLIEIKTVLGDGTSVAGTNHAHGKPLEKNDIKKLKENWQINSSFYLPDEIKKYAMAKLLCRNNLYTEHNKKDINLNLVFSDLYDDYEELRVSSGKILERIVKNNNNIIGGSADLASSTKTYVSEVGDFSKDNYGGQNIWYGVREHAMATISNGLALSGLRPYCSTFLAFADYMKPAIRQAAIMQLPVVYIFTHDAINIGSDGPTHQPIEQLAMLRSIPNLLVYRPADIKEVEGCYKLAFSSTKPSAIVLSRQKVRKQKNTRVVSVKKGAYITRKEKTLHGILIATGSELSIAMQVANELYKEKKIDLRVVSMPCMQLFKKQTIKYQNRVLPKGVKKVVIEAGSSFGWEGYVYSEKYLITINEFGASGASKDVLKKNKFNYEQIKKRIVKLI